MTKETTFTCLGDWHGAPVVPVTRKEWEEARRKPALAELCRLVRAGDEKLKRRLPVWTPHCAEFENNHRAIADALRPLSRLMLDFDERDTRTRFYPVRWNFKKKVAGRFCW